MDGHPPPLAPPTGDTRQPGGCVREPSLFYVMASMDVARPQGA